MSEATPMEEPAQAADVYAAAHTGCVVFDLSHRGKLELTGPEAARFLHNLTTQDVLNLPPGEGREAFAVTAKARVVAYFYLFHVKQTDGASAYWLDLPPGTAEAALRHLDRYRISEQVEFADRTREFAQWHAAGPRARAACEKAVGADAGCMVRGHDILGVPGYDILGPADRAAEVRARLVEAGARPAGNETYEILRVEAGTPAFGADVNEDTFVPEVGRARQAISYTKGCYLGQEPIVMARDRGHVNRQLLGLRLVGPASPGGLVFRDGKEIGRVTSSVVSPRLGPIALAYLRRGNWEPGTAVEVGAEGARRPATVSALPLPALTLDRRQDQNDTTDRVKEGMDHDRPGQAACAGGEPAEHERQGEQGDRLRPGVGVDGGE
jgi:folate-binding protein YgfZ